MKVIQLDSFDQILEFNVEWNDLLDLSKDDHVFLTLEWLAAWWKHFAKSRKLFLLAVTDKDRVLAVAPLMDSTYRLFGLKLRMIEFVGSPMSDYHGLILTEKSLTSAELLSEFISNSSWDCVELKNIPEVSETARVFRSTPKSSLKLKETVGDLCPFVSLPSTFEQYLQKLHRKMRRNLLRSERNLRKGHKVSFVPYTEIGSLRDSMNILFRLHQQRWQSKGQPGIFSDQAISEFHLDVAKRFDEKGWLRLYFLTVDDEPISAEYSFRYKQRLYFYLTGYDPAYARYGVGALTMTNAIKRSILDGSNEYDFMRGGHSYKEKFNAVIRKNIGLSVIRTKPIPMAYYWLMRNSSLAPLSEKLRRYAGRSLTSGNPDNNCA